MLTVARLYSASQRTAPNYRSPLMYLRCRIAPNWRNIDEAWGVVCELAGIEDARIHDCRHSFASRALALGENLPMIGRLLGHSEEQTTERYAHLDRDWVREGAIRISESLAADILTGYPGRPGTAPEDVRGGAADSGAARSVLAFPAQFRGRPTRAA